MSGQYISNFTVKPNGPRQFYSTLANSLNFRSSAAILVRHLGFQNLDFDCAVCEVHSVPY